MTQPVIEAPTALSAPNSALTPTSRTWHSRLLSYASNEPLAILLFILASVFVVSATFFLIGWTAGVGESRLRLPLLMSGLALVTIAMLMNRGSASTLVAILIVGVLIAPRDYLLRVAHMFARPNAPIGDYAKRYEGELILDGSEEGLSRLMAALEAQGVDPVARKAVGRIVSEEELSRLASQVRASGAFFPLEQIVEGGGAKRSLLDDYAGEGYFEHDLEFLRSESLVAFPGNDYQDVEATDRGRQLVDYMRGNPAPVFLDEWADPPSPSEMARIELDGSREVAVGAHSAEWLRFSVRSATDVVITARSPEGGDPFLRLFRPDDPEPFASDDDGGGGLSAELISSLSVGEYVLEVRNLFGTPAVVVVEVGRR